MPLSVKDKLNNVVPFKKNRQLIICFAICCTINVSTFAGKWSSPADSSRSSTLREAIDYLQTIKLPDSSIFWPNVKSAYFLENLDFYITNPLFAFENKNTNFCGYTALSFVMFEKDPAGFLKFMVKLYKEGKAQIGNTVFEPSRSVRKMAGNLKYKGMLDINPATQMWLLTLADHFKGYLNLLNHNYQPGDENTMWASTNFAKFNKMLRHLLNWKVHGRGSDLVRPSIHNLPAFLDERLKTSIVFLYLNNRLLYKKKHVGTRLGIPTHYVVLKHISQSGDTINIMYVDGGRETFQQISPALLRKIVFGVTWCNIK